ncbi:hypothetical protein [Pectobacterium sp. CHL-2024]|uniref:hypothetical protein n=1 Tax=Pectobacterium sp. CHL-2024 TaxID=3377079 RepID=UPI003800E744
MKSYDDARISNAELDEILSGSIDGVYPTTHETRMACELISLRTQFAELEKQEPVAWRSMLHGPNAYVVTLSKTVADSWTSKGWPTMPLYAHPVPPLRANQVDELVMMIKRLACRVKKYNPDDNLHQRAMDYLAERRLISVFDCLRSAPPATSQPCTVLDEVKSRKLFEAWFSVDCSFDRSPEATDADNYAWKESLWHTWEHCRAAMLKAGDA